MCGHEDSTEPPYHKHSNPYKEHYTIAERAEETKLVKVLLFIFLVILFIAYIQLEIKGKHSK